MVTIVTRAGKGSMLTHDEVDANFGNLKTAVEAAEAALPGYQPLDSDLTAIAALSTTAFGRALLVLANAAAGRTAFGLGTAAVEDATAFQPVDSDLTAIAALATTAFGRGFLVLADAAAARTALALGTAALAATGDFDPAGSAAAAQAASQPLDSDLTAIAALTTTAFGRSLLVLADAAAARAAIGAALTATQVGYGGAGHTMTGSADFTYDPATKVFTLTGGVATQNGITAYNLNGGVNAHVGVTLNNLAGSQVELFKNSDGSVGTGGLEPSLGGVRNGAGGKFALLNNSATDVFMTVAGTGTGNVYFLVLGADGSGSKVGNVGIGYGGVTNPTARLQLAAGSATAGTAPLKLTSGTNLTTPEDGAFEFDGTNLYFTTGGVRKTVTLV